RSRRAGKWKSGGGTRVAASQSSGATFFRHGQTSTHHVRPPLPVRRIRRELFAAIFRDAIKLGLTVVGRSSPLGSDPSSLLQPHERRIDRSLIKEDFIPAYLLDASRNA